MRKIIALYRSGDKGKTETLNYVIEILRSIITGQSIPLLIPNYTDRRETFICNGFKVSICTKGDNGGEILQNEAYFNSQQCDIAITASRSRGSSPAEVKAMSHRSEAPIQWIRKSVAYNNIENHINMSDAHRVISNIF